jgi:hypothetical protein
MSYILIRCSSVNFSEYRSSSIQFNLFSFNGLIAGFLFTGLSIIMTIAEKDGISRLYKGGYLDQFYNTLILGIIHHIIAIAIGLVIILRPNEANVKWIMFQFANEVIGVCLFITSVFYLQFLLRLMKKYRKDN